VAKSASVISLERSQSGREVISASYQKRNNRQEAVALSVDGRPLPARQQCGVKRTTKRNHLGEWRRHRRFSQETLADAAGTSKATISRLEAGKRGLSQKWLETLGPILDATPAQLLEEPGAARRSADMRSVPLIDSVQAGHWTEVADPYAKGDAEASVPVMRHVGPRAFALRIEGNSMEPDFRDGDIIVVDPDVQPQPGRYVVARIEEENAATFKRYREKGRDSRGRAIVELVPLNPDWPVLSIANSKGGSIVGVAVEHHRSLV
jgi:SOS-response transcriptional repressor LexA